MPYKRFVAKATTWEFTSHFLGGLLIYMFTGELKLATEITLVSVPLKVVVYTLHEKIWSLTKWGR